MDSITFDKNWSIRKKLSFRYLFVFFTLIIFPFPLSLIPGSNFVTRYYDQLWTAMINFSGQTFFALEEPVSLTFTGSGDKLYDWLWYFCIVSLTILIGSIFSILDRKRANYNLLKSWFALFVTYYLVYFLFVYGIIKLFYLQFVPPNLERLYQTFGQASPMRILWTFMGSSESYTIFAGFSETLAGTLLLFRRTRTLGALTAFGVMLNVFMLNMSYDVPVKLFSFQLMLIALYIASLDSNRLVAFFIQNRPAPISRDYPLVKSNRSRFIILAFQVIFAIYVISNQIIGGIGGRKQYGVERAKSPLYGVYNVDNFIRNNDTIPPLVTDSTRWKRILFDYPAFSSIILMDDNVLRYDSKIDTLLNFITFSPRGDTITKYNFKYELNSGHMDLQGIIEYDTIKIQLQFYDLTNFGLLNRGFHWVNEVPYNRYNYD